MQPIIADDRLLLMVTTFNVVFYVSVFVYFLGLGTQVVSGLILPRIASGDRSAVGECLDRYGGLVWSLALRMLGSKEDAEDASQEIFVELWQSAPRYAPEKGSEATFIATIARRRLIDRQRRAARDRGSAAETLDEIAGPEQRSFAEISEEAAIARKCLGELRDDEREVLELSIYHGCTQSTIAERTGLPLGTVKSHARRGLHKLRERLTKQPVAAPDEGALNG